MPRTVRIAPAGVIFHLRSWKICLDQHREAVLLEKKVAERTPAQSGLESTLLAPARPRKERLKIGLIPFFKRTEQSRLARVQIWCRGDRQSQSEWGT